jgi:3-oxoacyl-[acyl-carrier-protein] synthase II
MRHRVAITGMGVVSPIGCTLDAFRASLLAGASGVGPITLLDPASFRTRMAAEVKEAFDNGLRDRKITFACEAARRAVANAGEFREGQDAGLSLGLGLELFSMDDLAASRRPVAGALVAASALQFSMDDVASRCWPDLAPPQSLRERLTFLQTPSDLCVHLISKTYGLNQPPRTHVSACAAGTDAIGNAFRLVRSGRWRWALAGGTDSMINPLGLAGFCKIGATSTRNDEPQRASRPFDAGRDGFVLGEGAAVLVLERLDNALARGARVHAEIVGYGNSLDAHGISEPHPEGRGAYQAMARAVADAGVSPDVIDCVNAHGSSTPKNDVVETLAIKRLLGERARRVPVVSTKSMIGHLIAAAGAVEAVAAVLCMQAGMVHPTINLDEPDAACDLDYVPHTARLHEQCYVLSNSFGFGGQNAAILLRNGRSIHDQ